MNLRLFATPLFGISDVGTDEFVEPLDRYSLNSVSSSLGKAGQLGAKTRPIQDLRVKNIVGKVTIRNA